MPAVLMPISVASCTARNNGSNLLLNVRVQAQSMMRPFEYYILILLSDTPELGTLVKIHRDTIALWSRSTVRVSARNEEICSEDSLWLLEES